MQNLINELFVRRWMEKNTKQVNVRVKDGEQFLAHETTINFNPTEFVFDFKCITPIQELNQSSLFIKHNIVMMTPWHVKSFIDAMRRIMGDYEKRFGEIKKPVEIQKAEKLIKKQKKESTTTNPVVDSSYFG